MNTSSRPFALNLYSFLQDVLSDFFGGQRLVQNMRFLFEPSSSSDAQALITLSLQKICVINLGSNWRTRRVTHKTIITMIVSWELARDGNLIPFIFYFTRPSHFKMLNGRMFGLAHAPYFCQNKTLAKSRPHFFCLDFCQIWTGGQRLYFCQTSKYWQNPAHSNSKNQLFSSGKFAIS